MTEKKDVTVSRSGSPASWFPHFDTLHDEIDAMFHRFLSGNGVRGWHLPASLKTFELVPKVDVSEDAGHYQITVEVPGVSDKDIKVSVADGVLTVEGEKKSEHTEEKKNYHLAERSYGSFKRTFALPDDADDGKIDANVTNGVLKVSVAKSARPKSGARQISVKAA